MEAGGAVTLQAAGDLNLAGSRIATPGRIEGKAGGDLRLISVQDSVTPMSMWLLTNNQAVQSTRVTAELAGGQGIQLDAGHNIALQGAVLQSGKDLSLTAGDDLQLFPLALENRQNAQNYSVTQAVTGINAQGDINLQANKNLLAFGGEIKSETGNVTLNAGEKLELASVLEQSQSYRAKDSGGLFSKTKITITVDETVKGVQIETGDAGKLTLKSGSDMALESVNLKSGTGGLEIESAGNLRFMMAEENHLQSRQTEHDWVVWQKNQIKGQSNLTGIENQLQSEGPIQIKVANGLGIEYAQRKGETAEAALERVSGTPWLMALGQEREIDWQPRADGQQNWSKSHQGLSPLGAAVVAFVVAYYAGPYIGKAVGSALATAEITVSAATQTAITAGATAAVANVAVQLGTNGKVDGKQVFQSALLAGLTAGITEAQIWGESNQSLNQLAGIKTNGVLNTADKGFLSNLSGEQMLALGGRSVISATLNKVIFGTDFEEGFKSSLTSDLSALFAKDIGKLWGNGQNPGMQTLAHMGLGAASAKITGQDPAAGAIGGLVESTLGNILTHNGVEIDPKNRMDYALYTSGSMLAAGLTAQLLGKDPQEVATAANVAKNAAENNFLTAPRFMDKAKELEACKANSECSEREILSRYQQEWDRNVAEFEKNPSLMKGFALQEIRAALVVLLGQGCDASSACPSSIQISNSIAELDELIYRESDPYGYKLDKLRDGLILDAVLLGTTPAISLINKIWGLFRAAEVATVTTGVVTQTVNAAKGGTAIEASALRTALEKATPTPGNPNQLMAVLDDGTRVIFRKDFGAEAHRLGGPFRGAGKIDHYNIEIQVPKHDPRGGVNIIENVHVVPDGKGGYTWWGTDGVIKK
ncbi:hypothetical protein AGMMS49545_22840 [Betaproteobacteria bacterium]|nr:hypothetical protein AGMMS49545_22840 [Betaproteobacteria bacterium]